MRPPALLLCGCGVWCVVLSLPRSRCVLVHAALARVLFALAAALVVSFCLLVLDEYDTEHDFP